MLAGFIDIFGQAAHYAPDARKRGRAEFLRELSALYAGGCAQREHRGFAPARLGVKPLALAYGQAARV